MSQRKQPPAQPQEAKAATQLTPEPYKNVNLFYLKKFLYTQATFPFFASTVAITSQAVNPYFAQNNLRYGGSIFQHFKFLIDRIRDNGLFSIYRGFIPYFLVSYEYQLTNYLFVYLQKKGIMPVNVEKLKRAPRRRTRRVKRKEEKMTEQEKKQAEVDLEEAEKLREEVKNTKVTLKSTIKYFLCDFGSRTLFSIIFSPLTVLVIKQINDLNPEPKIDTFVQRATSILEKEGLRGFFRGLKYTLLNNIILSIAYTAQWAKRADWFGFGRFRSGINLILLKAITIPLLGLSRMRMITDQELGLFSKDTGLLKILSYNLQIPLIIASMVLPRLAIVLKKAFKGTGYVGGRRGGQGDDDGADLAATD